MVILRTLSQPAGATAISTTQTNFWDVIDAEFRSIVASTSIRLASNEINTAEAGDIFSTLFKAHLERHEILKEPKKPGSGKATEIVRRTSRIEKASEHLRKMKNTGRKNRKQDRSSFNNLIRAHNKVKKACDKLLMREA